MRILRTFFASLALFLAFSTSAFSAVDVSAVTLNVAPVETIAVTILGALSIIWVARKIISFLGR